MGCWPWERGGCQPLARVRGERSLAMGVKGGGVSGPAHRRWRRAEWLRVATRRGGSSGDGAFETIQQRQGIGGRLCRAAVRRGDQDE